MINFGIKKSFRIVNIPKIVRHDLSKKHMRFLFSAEFSSVSRDSAHDLSDPRP
jgi:hypothetical protein